MKTNNNSELYAQVSILTCTAVDIGGFFIAHKAPDSMRQ